MTTGDYTRAVFGSLSQGESDFARIYAQVTETTQTLESRLNTQLSAWDGQAKDAYAVAKAKWQAAEANMAAVLNNLRAVAGEANAGYQATEASNAALFS
jgi:early secretory antigenic target protein ESAT-6